MNMASSLVNLRPYQKQAIADVRAALERSGSVVLQMPTGSGKTVTAAEFIRQESAKGPVWFICHRREIIRQASKAFSALGVSHDVIAPKPEAMGLGFGYSPGARVKIASVQTLSRRSIENYDAPRLAFWDECHRAAAKTWSSIIKALPNTLHVGLTATPERLDGKGLSDLFSDLVCGPSIQALIDATPPALSRVRIFAPTQPDLTKARISMGDYRKEDADAIMNTPVIIGDAVAEYRRHAGGSRALVFATSVAASKNIADKFNSEGIPAAHVDGDTPVAERDAAVSDLGAGRIKVLTNVEVFTEGVDVPEVDTVILLRPTRSLALYLQMVGRGMRPADGKDRLTILDHAGLVYEQGLPFYDWQWSLEGGARKRRIMAAREAGERLRKCPECSHVHPITPVCDECGFEYPSGREVGGYDGHLSAIPEFLSDGEPQQRFAKRYGISHRTVAAYAQKGDLDTHPNGWIVLSSGLQKMERLLPIIKSRFRRSDGENETISSFAMKYGVDQRVVLRWGMLGMPMNGPLVPAQQADLWVSENKVSRGVSEKLIMFAERHGGSKQSINTLKKEGIPLNIEGMVISADAEEWLERHYVPRMSSAIIPPRFRGFEPPARFSSRLGRAKTWVYKQPIPRHPQNGWVHIRKGLEWVRDNTNIAIPPEAWPKDDGGEDA